MRQQGATTRLPNSIKKYNKFKIYKKSSGRYISQAELVESLSVEESSLWRWRSRPKEETGDFSASFSPSQRDQDLCRSSFGILRKDSQDRPFSPRSTTSTSSSSMDSWSSVSISNISSISHNDIQNFSKARFSLHFYSYFRTTGFITGLSPVNLQRTFNYK